MAIVNTDRHIRCATAANCCVCHAKGQPLYTDLTDPLWGVAGSWNMARCSNRECGTLWLDPMPVAEDLPWAYRAYYTHDRASSRLDKIMEIIKDGHLANRFGWNARRVSKPKRAIGWLAYLDPVRRPSLDYLVGSLLSLPRGRFLDVGCGDGQWTQIMADMGWEAEGVDFDPEAVHCARRKGLIAHHGTLQNQHFDDGKFDALLLSHVMEHVPDPRGLLAECHRIMRPGAQMLVLTPNAGSWGHRTFGECWRGLEPPRHLHLFTLSSLVNVVTQTGFEVVRAESTLRNADKILRLSQRNRLSARGGGSRAREIRAALSTIPLLVRSWRRWKNDKNLGEEIDIIATRH